MTGPQANQKFLASTFPFFVGQVQTEVEVIASKI